MEIIPVIDIMNGIAVSGKSGRRKEYTELKTVFASSSDPVEIAKNLPHKRLYVADLDGIMKGAPNLKMLEELSRIKRLMVDVGIKNLSDYNRISNLDAEIIVGSETLCDFDTLETISRERQGLIFSIDIKDKKVLSPFLPHEPIEVFELLVNRIKRFIILSMPSVGTLSADFSLLGHFCRNALLPSGEGSDTDLDRIKYPDVEVYYGGGIKKENINKLEKMGISGVLAGTALHRGLL